MVAQAQAEMQAVTAQMGAAHPSDYALRSAVVAPLDEYLFGSHERLFTLLLVAVGLVLLIACANVANLLLARALRRQREFVLRSALGASRAAILRQVLAESMVIALAGGTVIAEVEQIVPVGMIPPDHVVTPAVLVDYLVARN